MGIFFMFVMYGLQWALVLGVPVFLIWLAIPFVRSQEARVTGGDQLRALENRVSQIELRVSEMDGAMDEMVDSQRFTQSLLVKIGAERGAGRLTDARASESKS